MKKGFTLIEVLIVISILALLAVGVLFSVSKQRAKAEDAKIKAYLNNLKIAFEDYYGDKNCYPPPTWFDGTDDCQSSNLSPYLKAIQCDKKTGLPYVYEVDPTQTNCPQWYKIYATFNLPDTDEQAIAQRSATGSTKGNYGVSSSNVSVSVFYDAVIASPTPMPTPSIIPGATYSYCSALNNCTSFIPTSQYCTPYWVNDGNCGGNNTARCTTQPEVGTCN